MLYMLCVRWHTVNQCLFVYTVHMILKRAPLQLILYK